MENDKTKILIIDDDPGIGEMLKTLLEFSGYRAEVLDRPLEAKKTILEYNADIVILDVRLSGVDGTEVCKDLRQDNEVGNVPIIMMSALTGADIKCKKAGADEFVSKPFEMDEMLTTIENVLSQKEKERS